MVTGGDEINFSSHPVVPAPSIDTGSTIGPVSTVMGHSVGGALGSLLAALDEIRLLSDTDLILRRAVELVRDRIGLKRAGIFLLDPSRKMMLGTWGMDLSCKVVDEHSIAYGVRGTDLETLRRTERDGAHFVVCEDCPIIEHPRGETRIAGRGWVAKTPIRATPGVIGMMFNDAALTGGAVDESKQAHAAILCALLGTMLDPVREGLRSRTPGQSPSERLVASAVAMINKRPEIGGKELATALNISLSRLARVFKILMGMSLVEYRNRLRLDRFEALLDRGRSNLLETAMEAGFGSYAQFHRVFRTHLHATPREYLRPAGGDRRPPAATKQVDLARGPGAGWPDRPQLSAGDCRPFGQKKMATT